MSWVDGARILIGKRRECQRGSGNGVVCVIGDHTYLLDLLFLHYNCWGAMHDHLLRFLNYDFWIITMLFRLLLCYFDYYYDVC